MITFQHISWFFIHRCIRLAVWLLGLIGEPQQALRLKMTGDKITERRPEMTKRFKRTVFACLAVAMSLVLVLVPVAAHATIPPNIMDWSGGSSNLNDYAGLTGVLDPWTGTGYDVVNEHSADAKDLVVKNAAIAVAAADATTKANAAQAAAIATASADASTKATAALTTATAGYQAWTPKTAVYTTTTATGGIATFTVSGFSVVSAAFPVVVRNTSTPASMVGAYVKTQSTGSVVVQCTESMETVVLILNTNVDGLEACPAGLTVNLMVTGS